jgi:hypothetical protein
VVQRKPPWWYFNENIEVFTPRRVMHHTPTWYLRYPAGFITDERGEDRDDFFFAMALPTTKMIFFFSHESGKLLMQ